MNTHSIINATVKNSEKNKMNSLDFSVESIKFTDESFLHIANESTMRHEKQSNQTLNSAYMSEHSTIRTQKFSIILKNIPLFVAQHYVRHSIGNTYFMGSQRHDNNGKNEGRWTPTSLTIDTNAQSLIQLARTRLCECCSKETITITETIILGLEKIDPALAFFMVPNCVYRNGICKEGKRGCGKVSWKLNKYKSYIRYMLAH